MSDARLAWVVLTMGDRWPEVLAAIESLQKSSPGDSIVLVLNGDIGERGDERPDLPDDVRLVELPENIGVPAGRAAGVAALAGSADYVGFLDDDAILMGSYVGQAIRQRFEDDPAIAVVSMRLLDPDGETARRHSPRIGRRGLTTAGPVPTFLGGASVVRSTAYETVGGYWGELFYSHEELELSWRLIDAGFDVYYDPAIVVKHPKTDIARHAHGWELTGRNRVRIARRNLPLPVLVAHTMIWLVAGVYRAPGLTCRRAYVQGWTSGWRMPVNRKPMRWSTVRRLTELGRPPIV